MGIGNLNNKGSFFVFYKDFIFKNFFVKPSFTMFFWRGLIPIWARRGLFDRPCLCLRGIPSKPPLNTPDDLAGARPNNTQKALRLKISNSLRSNSEIFLTSPNFLLTTLLACDILA